MVCSSWTFSMMLPSPARHTTRRRPCATHAPIAAGRSKPIGAQPESENSRWPPRSFAA